MKTALLTINAGSSSLKFALFSLEHQALVRKYRGLVANIGGRGGFSVRDEQGAKVLDSAEVAADHEHALSLTLAWCREAVSYTHLTLPTKRIV